MSNTLIQIKRSTVTATPADGSLSAGELAYSYASEKLFSGNSTGTGVIEIGGRYYVNTAIRAENIAIAAFEKANTGDTETINAAFNKANTSYDIAVLAYDKANAANLLAYNTGIGANAFASETITGANTAVGAGANAYSDYVGTLVGAGANAFAAATIAGANTAVGAGANAYADTVASGSNNYANTTFVKLTAPNQTITGNLAITGSLTIAGNAYTIDTETLRVSDPLLYLAGNNYSSDIVDIGFIANYNNGSANLHTGFYREHTSKEYYLFQGYSEEPYNNHIDPTANGFTLAVLNADIKTNNLTLSGVDATSWIGSVYDKANGAVQTGFVTIAANGTSVVADSNTDTLTINAGPGISIVGNASTDEIDFGLTLTGVVADSYGSADSVATFTVDDYGRITAASAVPIAIDAAAITSGILTVPFGGTGVGTFATNGILYGNGTSSLKITDAGTEGQVLQASSSGVPQFGMLDGGSF